MYICIYICIWIHNFVFGLHICYLQRQSPSSHTTHPYFWHNSYIYGTWHNDICDRTHRIVTIRVKHNAIMTVTWQMHTCDKAWHNYDCDMSNAHVWRGSHKFFSETIMMSVRVCVWQKKSICTCACVCDTTNPCDAYHTSIYAMPHSHVWHDASHSANMSVTSHMCFARVTWLGHKYEILHPYFSHQIFIEVACIALCTHTLRVCHDSFCLVRVTWRIYAWLLDYELENSFYSHNMSMIGRLFHIIRVASSVFHTCDLTHSHVTPLL